MSNLFSGLAGASVTGEGVKLPAGTYGIRITRCHIHRSQNQGSKIAGHELAIIEFDVAQSAHPSAREGQSFSCSIDMNDPTYGPGNMKGFILGILGVDHNNAPEVAKIDPHLQTIAGAAFDGRNIFGPQGPGQDGLLVLVNVIPKTAKAGHTYMRHVFAPVPGMPAQIHEVIGRMQRAPNPIAPPPPAPNAYAAPQAPPMQAAPMAPHWQPQQAPPMQAPQGWPAQPPQGPPPGPQYAPQAPQGWPAQTPPPPPAPQYPPGYGAPAPAPMPMGAPPGMPWPQR